MKTIAIKVSSLAFILALWGLLMAFTFNWFVYWYIGATTVVERDVTTSQRSDDISFMKDLAENATTIKVGAEVRGLEVREPHGYEHLTVEHQRDLLPENL